MNTASILFVTHKKSNCGVYEFGYNIADALAKSERYSFVFAECASAEEFYVWVNNTKPLAIVYNQYPSATPPYHSVTLPWLRKKVIQKIKVPHVGIIHEITQAVADKADDSLFDFHIAPDPTLMLKNPLVFKTGRLVPEYENLHELPAVPVIGSFGFGTFGKGFERLISTVQNEFDEAIIRLHIPFATFGDSDGSAAHAIAGRCKELIVKRGIELQLSHEFLNKEQLLSFLAQNTLNAFFYDRVEGRGISSVIDYAVAVRRPVAITKSAMFRHIVSATPTISIEDSSLQLIIKNGFGPLERYRKEWCQANLVWDYERIIDEILSNSKRKCKTVAEKMQQSLNRILKKTSLGRSADSWIPTPERSTIEQQSGKEEKCPSFSIDNVVLYNRILDNDAREQYKPVIDSLFAFLPDIIARKIPEANIQQAFVLDTVYKWAAQFTRPRTLCIGSYDDTACVFLKKCGYVIDEVDPVMNYDLNTYMSKPTTVAESYDIIFSTSVIEHVADDELFITQIVELLAPGGIAVLTCDFNDQYVQGDMIPKEDFRFYTRKDFVERLLPLLKNCHLVDEPEWSCVNPDFVYAGCCYTFATFVFRKNIQ